MNKWTVLAMCSLTLAAAAGKLGGQDGKPDTMRTVLWQPGMTRSDVGEVNVFRRFPRDLRAKMTEFYGEVLGIKPLPDTAAGGNAMIRYPVGSSEVKLFPVATANENRARPVRDVVGIRLVTLFFPDENALVSRFREHGFATPEFRSMPDKTKGALVQDPDGQWVELLIVPGAPQSTYNRFEIGLTVADLEKSRSFYRDFMGMDEAKPVMDPLLGTTKYSYRHGATTISLWSFGKDLPKDTNTAGIQYIVWNVEGADKIAKARGATIDRPLSAPGSPRTVWLVDPDGITNYFAQFAENNNTPPSR